MDTTLNATVGEIQDAGVSRAPVNLLASTLRRTTCDVCRGRKVRCDRTKPECLRCRRFGSICTYPSPEADTVRIQETLNSLSKRLDDAENRLQSHQASIPTVALISAPNGQAPDFTNVDRPTHNGSGDAFEDAEISAWYSDQPMVESLLPDNVLFHGIADPVETTVTSERTSSILAGNYGGAINHESLSETMATVLSIPHDNGIGICSVSVETCTGLYDAYFHVVQQHLPLIMREDFFLLLKDSSEKHHTLALKYAVCMAGAKTNNVAFQTREQYYVAARHHLEQAERGVGGSSFWSVPAAQALVLVARFELEHFTDPRATITMSRLFTLISTLRHNGNIELEMGQAQNEKDRDQRKRVSQINPSICLAAYIYLENRSQPPPALGINDIIDLERLKIDLLTDCPILSENGPFSILCVALRISFDAKHHDRMTAAAVAGIDPPSFNFCRTHDQIETRIGTLVTKGLVSSPPTVLLSKPHCELRILALLVALGARVQLFKTASYHGQMSRFLNTISSECREEGVSSAIDMSDLLSFAGVHHPDKMVIYREASIYLMPPLQLAAEVLVTALPLPEHDGSRRVSHRHFEIRQALRTIVQVMHACRDEAGTYNECIEKFRTFLETSEASPTPLRTSFPASSSLGKN